MQGEEKQRVILAGVTAAFVSATFFLFGPIGLYIANLTEIWFPLADMLWPSLLACLLAAGALTGIGFLLRKAEKAFDIYLSVLWGIGLALYIQGNYIPNQYGILNGETVEWGDYWQTMLWDALLWLGCLALPFILRRLLRKNWRQALQYGACALFAMQLLATGMTCLTTDFSQSGTSESYLSSKGLYEVADEQNVIVFILDTFDQKFFEDIYEEDPESLSYLDGFTYFSNMSGVYPQTKAAVAYILTSQYYENEQPYAQYIEQAWKNGSAFYQDLQENGFTINLYTDMEAAVSEQAKKQWISNASDDRIRVASYVGLEGAQLRLTAMKFFPDIVKPYIWEYGDPFEGLKSASEDGESAAPFDWTGSAFYKKLVEQGLSLVKGKRYTFIHLDGTHPPFTMLSDSTEAQAGQVATAITEAKGSLNIVEEYIRQLKDLGVYDNSCIVITGDHGYINTKSRPILLVKGMQETGDLAFSTAPVTHGNLQSTVMSELSLNEERRYGESVYDIDQADRPERRYLLYVWSSEANNKAYLPPMVEYNVLPDGNGPENYVLTGRTYTEDGLVESKPYQYEIGKTLYFGDTSTLSYFLSGMNQFAELAKDDDSEYLVYADGYSAKACFNVGEVGKELLAHIKFNTYVLNKKQRVLIKSAGSTLYDGDVLSGMQYINFVIPPECVQNGMLILEFEFPEAVTPHSINSKNGSESINSVAFKEIGFFELSSEESLVFSSGGSSEYNAEYSLYSGWHAIETDKTWTNETASLLAVLPEEPEEGPEQMTVTYWTHPGAKDTEVYYNGELAGTLPHHEGFASETLLLPEEYRSDSDAQLITFVTDGATSSKVYYNGKAKDERILGIAVSEISFEPANVLGRTISFSEAAALSYFPAGTESYLEQNGLWTVGKSAQARFYVGEPEKDLSCHIELYGWMPTGEQRVQISSQGRTLYDGTVTNDAPYINFAAPAACVRDAFLELSFKLPDACSPKSLGVSEDERELGIRFKSLLLEEQSETSGIDFTQGGGSENSLQGGWYGQEPDKRWTEERASVIAFRPEEGAELMTVTYWTHPGAKDTEVYYNGTRIGTLPHHEGFASETLLLPEEYRSDSGGQVVTFVTDGATSSKAYYGGDETDERTLGIAVSEISFKPANVVGRTISFSEAAALSYFTAGTESYLEEDGLWTVGESAQARFYVGEPEKDLSCRIELYGWMPAGEQRVQISSQGRTLYDGTVTNDAPYIEFDVPADCARKDLLELDFALPDACSPKSIGVSEDERELGIRFKSISFEEQGV